MNKKSISTKLSISILLMAVPIFILSMGILFIQSRNFINQKATDRANSALLSAMHHVRSYLTTIETATDGNKWLVMENMQPEGLYDISKRIVWLNRHVYGCSITTEPGLFPQYGQYLSVYSIRSGDSIHTEYEPEYNYNEADWYRLPHELGKSCWTEPFNDTGNDSALPSEFIASYSSPLFGKDGRFVGVLSTDLSLRLLSEALQEAELPYPHAYFVLVGHDGRYFVHPDSTRLFKQTIYHDENVHDLSDMETLGKVMTSGKQGSMRMVFDDKPSLVCYCPVPGTSWSLALVCPDKEILSSYHRFANVIFPLIIIGLLGILLLCHTAVTHAISPIHQLLNQSRTIASGHYDIHIPHTTRIDSVGRLQNSFATMQQSIDRHVSSIKQALKESERSNEELAHATAMAEEANKQKTSFIQNMTHQIRTPLNIILGFSQVLRDSITIDADTNSTVSRLPEDDFKKIIAAVKHNCTTLNRMVLMLFDSSDTGITEEQNIHKHDQVRCNELGRECVIYTESRFPGISIKFETDVPDNFTIWTNRLFLKRSICELLYNSAKYSDGQNIVLRITTDNEHIQFITEDTGPGIAEDYHEQMFKSFSKINDLSEGLGLGLPLSKQHAMNLGGNLIYDKDYDKGCRFFLELPLYTPTNKQYISVPATSPAMASIA